MVLSRRVECNECSDCKSIEFVALLRRIIESESHLYLYPDGVISR